MPFARRLTFRTDQIRYRRDHAKYLSLIATSALMHQYQRPRTTCQGARCIVATLDDVALANRLARETLCMPPHQLLPQTELLLTQLETLVTRCAHQHHIARHEVRFTQRQLRESLHWNDRALRRQLTRLVELEYVVAYRTGHGNGRMYQLLYEPRREDGPSWQLGLSDVEQLRAASQKLPCSLLAGRVPPRQ